jgi:two-component system, sensor histidine kinase and response regulator
MEADFTNFGAKILIIDDDPLAAKIITKKLKARGFETYSFVDAEDAYNFLAKNEVHLIICDLLMPNIDGLTFLEMSKALPNLTHVPFLFMTSIDNGEEISRCYHAGVDDYLVKPVSTENLLMIVRNRLDRFRSIKQTSDEVISSYSKRTIQTLSHEFRTPLVSLLTGSELLEREVKSLEGTVEEKKYNRLLRVIDAMRNGSQRLENLINDFLLMQQIQTGSLNWYIDYPKVDVSSRALIHRYFLARRDFVESQGYRLQIDKDLEDVQIRISEPQVFSILDRFLQNAFKFSPNNKDIHLSCSTSEKFGIIELKDDGRGLPKKYKGHDFVPFKQVDRDFHEQQGSGLGLVIAKQLADILGGKIRLKNRDETGVCAQLLLPKSLE